MNEILSKERHIYHEDLRKSESWKTADTRESIPVYGSARETFPVWLLYPDGTKIEEKCYKGDCKFGGEDVYALLTRWNWREQCSGDTDKDAELGRKSSWKLDDEVKHIIRFNYATFQISLLKFKLRFNKSDNLTVFSRGFKNRTKNKFE